MNIDKLKYNTLITSCFILALLIFLMQIPLVLSLDKTGVVNSILDWLRLSIPTFIKIPIKFILSTVLLPVILVLSGLSLLSCIIFLTIPSIIIIVDLITLYLTIYASMKYSILTKAKQIIMYISLFIEAVNIFMYLFIKSAL